MDLLQQWGKENNVHDSTIHALKEAGYEFEDLPHVTEGDINELNDGKGIPGGHKRRLLTRISEMVNPASTSSSGNSTFVLYKILITTL